MDRANGAGATTLASLYETDETAWLESMARLAAERRCDELDYDHLSEFLADMARRDRHEVQSRLTVLLQHLLKWHYQPGRRSNSWRATVVAQRQELEALFESGTLRRHGEEVLARAYRNAVARAASETGLSEDGFPTECPFTLDEALGQALPGEWDSGAVE